jgi:hypothetical protein
VEAQKFIQIGTGSKPVSEVMVAAWIPDAISPVRGTLFASETRSPGCYLVDSGPAAKMTTFVLTNYEREPLVMDSLPSTPSNFGEFITVSDSTAISAEGQTCVGSRSNVALAWSNGTVLKWF